MEIGRILSKLRPLAPKQVAAWESALKFSDASTKQLIEKQAYITAKRGLGNDFERKLLLSLPSRQIASGSIEIGTVIYEKEKWPFGVSKSELLQNMAIFGRSGAGKTNVVFQLLLQLKKQRVPFLFLDWKKTARHLLPHLSSKTTVFTPGTNLAPFPFNPLIPPPGMDRQVYLLQVIDLLAQAFTLGEGAKNVLLLAINRCFSKLKSPTIADVYDEISGSPSQGRQSGWKLSALRALESLRASLTSADARSQKELANKLLKQNTIIELDGLPANVRKFLIPLICSWLFSVRLTSKNRERLQNIIVFEEAHHVLFRSENRSEESLMNQLLRQGRELGIASIVVDQHPSLISSAALGNCYTTICLNLKNPADINKAAGLSLVGESDKHQFSLLKVGTGIVKMQDRFNHPFVIKIPLVPVAKGAVTDSLLSHYSKGKLTHSAFRKRQELAPIATENNRKRNNPTSSVNERFRSLVNVENEAFRLLEDVLAFPKDGVATRYQRLGFSAERGNKYRDQLVAEDLLAQTKQKVGRTHRVVLSTTEHARTILSSEEGNDPQGSLEHEYWKQAIAVCLRKNGYQVSLEFPRNKSTGQTDIRAQKPNRSVAIEIETGKSDVVSNVKRNLLESFDQVWVVATSDSAFAKIEKQLARAGLMIARRIRLFSSLDVVRLLDNH